MFLRVLVRISTPPPWDFEFLDFTDTTSLQVTNVHIKPFMCLACITINGLSIVLAEVLKGFQDKDGQFVLDSSSGSIPREQEIRSVLNLFRASHIAFPGEKVMDEAKAFSTAYLNQALEMGCSSPTLSKEVLKFVLLMLTPNQAKC